MLGKLASLMAAAVLAAVSSVPAIAQAPTPPAAAAAPTPPPGVAVRVRGTVEALNGNVLTFKTREGETININMAENFTVNAAIQKSWDDVAANAYIGVAGEEDAQGNVTALDLRVFNENQRGLGEGNRPWDLTPRSTMTNATVAAVEPGANGMRMIRVTYPGGEKMIMVAADAPLWSTEPGDRSLVVAGAYAVIGTRKLDDGTYTASGVTIEKNGIRPAN